MTQLYTLEQKYSNVLLIFLVGWHSGGSQVLFHQERRNVDLYTQVVSGDYS